MSEPCCMPGDDRPLNLDITVARLYGDDGKAITCATVELEIALRPSGKLDPLGRTEVTLTGKVGTPETPGHYLMTRPLRALDDEPA